MRRGYRVIDELHCPYFVTNTTTRWLPIFLADPYFDIVVSSLTFLRANKGVQINAFVVMPTHVHLVVWPNEEVNLSEVMRDFKRHTSKAISTELKRSEQIDTLQVLARHARKQSGADYGVWQGGFHPEVITSPAFARQKIEYIHNNPVRKGLVDTPEQWRYSSARNYAGCGDPVMEIDLLELS